MKNKDLFILLLAFLVIGQVTAQHPSAIVEYESADQGILIPRLSNTASVTNPAVGLMIYDMSVHAFQYFDGTSWHQVGKTNVSSVWSQNADTVYHLAGLVGIGTQSPAAKLDVRADALINGMRTGRGKGNIESNTVFGRSVLNSNTSGALNTANGYRALHSNTTGDENAAFGSGSLAMNISGKRNVAIGVAALRHNVDRSGLVAVGDSALFHNGLGVTISSQAKQNSALGSKALFYNSGGARNTAIGYRSLYSNTHGISNTAIGYLSLFANDIGADNVAVGSQALKASESGLWNVAVGSQALLANVSGNGNTAIGYQALVANTQGIFNTACGYQAAISNISGSWNTIVGRQSFYNNTTGIRSATSGYQSLFSNTSGEGNVAMGYQSLYANTTGDNNTALGYLAFYFGSNFTNSTAIGFGAEPNADNRVRLGNNAVTSIGGTVNWSVLSDARFKTTVQDDVPGLDFINRLRPVTYFLDMDAMASFHQTPDSLRLFDAENEKSVIRYSGFLAQDVEFAADQVGYDFSGIEKPSHDGDNYSLRYAEFVMPIIKAVQELAVEKDMLRLELESNNEMIELMRHEFESRLQQLEK